MTVALRLRVLGTPREVTRMRTEEVAGTKQVTRRRFCNSVVLASTAVVLHGKSLTAEAVPSARTTIEYPPMKIAGAEALMPGSFLYFQYPTRRDEAVLERFEKFILPLLELQYLRKRLCLRSEPRRA